MNARCVQCGGHGFVEVPTDGVVAMRRCECTERRVRRARIRRINATVPGIFRGVSLDANPIASLPKAQRARLRAYYKALPEHIDGGRGLWLTGESGVGKTAAAALMAKRALSLGYSSFFCEVPELLNRLRWTYRDDARV